MAEPDPLSPDPLSSDPLSADSLPPHRLPSGVRTRRVATKTGLDMHCLEAGDPAAPLVLLLHGFPELGFSWRHQLPALAAAGWHVVAPDQRGYGATTGWQGGFDDDPAPFRLPGYVDDAVALVEALGHGSAAAVIGHDMGSVVTAWGALTRPDVFRSAVLMSAPFAGAPTVPAPPLPGEPTIHEALAALPRPRKHYQAYFSGREAAPDMDAPRQGLAAFLRGYFHLKSGDWADNAPVPLAGWTAEALATLPTYYVMDLADDMPATVAAAMAASAPPAEPTWLTDADLAVYVEAYGRNGFQPALNGYRGLTDPAVVAMLAATPRRSIDVPTAFVGGRLDWGLYQKPGALEAMRDEACTAFEGIHLIDGAGHWVQQERAEAVNEVLLGFLERRRSRPA